MLDLIFRAPRTGFRPTADRSALRNITRMVPSRSWFPWQHYLPRFIGCNLSPRMAVTIGLPSGAPLERWPKDTKIGREENKKQATKSGKGPRFSLQYGPSAFCPGSRLENLHEHPCTIGRTAGKGLLARGFRMGRLQEVINRFNRVEGADRHFHEDRVPVRHRAIPQAGQFQGFQ